MSQIGSSFHVSGRDKKKQDLKPPTRKPLAFPDNFLPGRKIKPYFCRGGVRLGGAGGLAIIGCGANRAG